VGTRVDTIEFSWDEAKRQAVSAVRGIDFLDLAKALLDGRPLLTMPRRRGEEDRFVSVGLVGGRFYALVWTQRETAIRLITARRARDEEERQYRDLHG